MRFIANLCAEFFDVRGSDAPLRPPLCGPFARPRCCCKIDGAITRNCFTAMNIEFQKSRPTHEEIYIFRGYVWNINDDNEYTNKTVDMPNERRLNLIC